MAISFVKKQVYGDNTNVSPITFTGTTAGNALLIVYDGNRYGSAATVSDNNSNPYSYARTTVGYYAVGVAFCTILTGGDISISFSAAVKSVAVYEFSGLGNIKLDQSSSLAITSNDSSMTSGYTSTTLYNDELVLGVTLLNMFSGLTNTTSVQSGYNNFIKDTNDNGDSAVSAQTKIVSSTGTYESSISVASSWQGSSAIFTFYGLPSTTTGIQSLTGVGSLAF